MNFILTPLQQNSKSIGIRNLHFFLVFFKQQLNNEATNKLFADMDFIARIFACCFLPNAKNLSC